MCLLVIVSRLDRTAPLVVGANRDERLERRATAMTILQSEGPRILGGRDEEAGGTWLAVNEHGVVAALTNRPAPDGRDPTKRSRGELPIALASHAKAGDAVEEFLSRFDPADFNPAWLLVGDRHSLFSIDMTGERPTGVELPPGVHILENLPLGAPSPKVDRVRNLVGSIGVHGVEGDALEARLRSVLADHKFPAVNDEEVAPAAGERERPPETNAACVHTEDYGTRSSTIVRVGEDEGTPIQLRVAEGHPCEAPFSDVTGLWDD